MVSAEHRVAVESEEDLESENDGSSDGNSEDHGETCPELVDEESSENDPIESGAESREDPDRADIHSIEKAAISNGASGSKTATSRSRDRRPGGRHRAESRLNIDSSLSRSVEREDPEEDHLERDQMSDGRAS